MDFRPASFSIKTWRGDTLSLIFDLKADEVPIDLTTATLRMQIRPDYGSNTLSLALSESDGLTVTGTDNNQVQLRKAITIPSGDYVYDLEAVFSDGTIKTYVKGDFIVSEDATK